LGCLIHRRWTLSPGWRCIHRLLLLHHGLLLLHHWLLLLHHWLLLLHWWLLHGLLHHLLLRLCCLWQRCCLREDRSSLRSGRTCCRFRLEQVAWGATCSWFHYTVLGDWLLWRLLLIEIRLLLLGHTIVELWLLLHAGASHWWWVHCLRWRCSHCSLLATVRQYWGLD